MSVLLRTRMLPLCTVFLRCIPASFAIKFISRRNDYSIISDTSIQSLCRAPIMKVTARLDPIAEAAEEAKVVDVAEEEVEAVLQAAERNYSLNARSKRLCKTISFLLLLNLIMRILLLK